MQCFRSSSLKYAKSVSSRIYGDSKFRIVSPAVSRSHCAPTHGMLVRVLEYGKEGARLFGRKLLLLGKPINNINAKLMLNLQTMRCLQ